MTYYGWVWLATSSSTSYLKNLQLFHVQLVLVKCDDSQFTCKGSTIWILLKIIGVHKFILLVIIDYGERWTCFPFDRGKIDCYLFSSGPPCLQGNCNLCQDWSVNVFTDSNIEFDWRCNMYDIVQNKFLAIPSTCGKEGVMVMYLVDVINLYFGLIARLAIYKIYMFGDSDLVVPSSTLLHFGLLKTFYFIIMFDCCKVLWLFSDDGWRRCIEQVWDLSSDVPPIKFPKLYCQQYGNDFAVMSPSPRPGLACEVNWCVLVHHL